MFELILKANNLTELAAKVQSLNGELNPKPSPLPPGRIETSTQMELPLEPKEAQKMAEKVAKSVVKTETKLAVEPEAPLSEPKIKKTPKKEKEYDAEDVQKLLQQVFNKKGMPVAKQVLNAVGASKISEVSPAKYNDFVALANAELK